MLSKVANRVYWLGRYMERTENTAKLVNVYTGLLLDMPKGTDVGWHSLLKITGSEEDFSGLYDEASEQNVTSFLLTDQRNSGSMLCSLSYARENARTSRDILPREAWEAVNEIYILAKTDKDTILSRSGRYQLLTRVIQGGQRLEGILAGGLSRNHTHTFLHLGRLLERADTTSRIMDAGALLLSESSLKKMRSLEGIVWMNLLKTLSAYQMYRQAVKRQIVGTEVIRFLLKDTKFPRSVAFCAEAAAVFASRLPNSGAVKEKTSLLLQRLKDFSPDNAGEMEIHKFMDEIQLAVYDIDSAVSATWFNSELAG
ncbi:alpha-E domain-containing protein [Geovibrio thiophilus]|nr:alpha-E domain-containing protein [Geovibrio thiophilus]